MTSPCDPTRRAFCLKAAALALAGCSGKGAELEEETSAPSDTDAPSDTGGPSDTAPPTGDSTAPSDTASDTGEPDTEVFLSYDEHPQLRAAGGWALFYNSTGVEILVVRLPEGVRALLGLCTHEGCPTTFSAEQGVHLCPCHGGVFSIGGLVVGGPPPSSMYTREIRETPAGIYVDLEEWY